MKKFILGLAAAASLLPITAAAKTPSVAINGQLAGSSISPIIVDDRTLIPARSMAELLGYDIEWDGAAQTVTVSKDEDVLLFFIGASYFSDNGQTKTIDVPAQIINGLTYIPARMTAKVFDCDVHWDDASNTVNISTDASDIKLLANYGLISEDDLHKDGYMTNAEAVELFYKMTTENPGADVLRSWYSDPDLEPLDNIDDQLKEKLLYINVLSTEDILNIDLDENITEAQALIYITRMIGDTFTCVDEPIEWSFTDISQTYETAVKKGLIESSDTANADKPIERQYLYSIVRKALFVKRSVVGYVPAASRYIDLIAKSRYFQKQECIYQEYDIEAEVTFNHNMSISWKTNEEYLPDNCVIDCYSDDGSLLYSSTYSSSKRNLINSAAVLEMCTANKPASYIVISYSEYNDDRTINISKNITIDLSLITAVTEGEAPTPDVYTRKNSSWLTDSVTLSNEKFQPGVYYILTGYEHKYRKKEFNRSDKMVITVAKPTPMYSSSVGEHKGLSFYDEIHLRTAVVTGDPENGFVIHITPESPGTFTVIEAQFPDAP